MSPYFIVSPDSTFSFYHQYNLETGWDYTYVEIENGSGWWQTLDEYNGLQSTWIQEIFSLAEYSGQTVRLRFRLVSDYSVYTEGWYVDDVLVPMLGVQELDTPQDLQHISLSVTPNPFANLTTISFSIAHVTDNIELNIFDAAGRVVKSFHPVSSIENQESTISWQGDDNAGRKLPCGVYFVTMKSYDNKIVEKAILLK